LPLFLLCRHAESTLNRESRVNGDPSVDVRLTEQGRTEAERLGAQVDGIPIDLCVHTRFPRTAETAAIALAGRGVPTEVDARLDDIKVGDLEGLPLERYREAKRELGRRRPFPGGESLDQAAARFAAAFTDLARRDAAHVLVVCHEIPVRYALNAAAGSEHLDGPPFHDLPNAVPFLFDGATLARSAQRIAELAA